MTNLANNTTDVAARGLCMYVCTYTRGIYSDRIRIWVYVNDAAVVPRRRASMQTAKSAPAAYPVPLSAAEMLHLGNVCRFRNKVVLLRATLFIPAKLALCTIFYLSVARIISSLRFKRELARVKISIRKFLIMRYKVSWIESVIVCVSTNVLRESACEFKKKTAILLYASQIDES